MVSAFFGDSEDNWTNLHASQKQGTQDRAGWEGGRGACLCLSQLACDICDIMLEIPRETAPQ